MSSRSIMQATAAVFVSKLKCMSYFYFKGLGKDFGFYRRCYLGLHTTGVIQQFIRIVHVNLSSCVLTSTVGLTNDRVSSSFEMGIQPASLSLTCCRNKIGLLVEITDLWRAFLTMFTNPQVSVLPPQLANQATYSCTVLSPHTVQRLATIDGHIGHIGGDCQEAHRPIG